MHVRGRPASRPRVDALRNDGHAQQRERLKERPARLRKGAPRGGAVRIEELVLVRDARRLEADGLAEQAREAPKERLTPPPPGSW